jgi:small subunit ribosomal protein S16
MLVIRLLRIGKKNQPSFKIVVTERKRPPKGGRFIEEVGFWNPLTEKKVLKTQRIKYWLSKGAQPSDTVHNLLISENIIKGKKIPKHKKPKEKPKLEAVEEKKPKEKAEEIKEEPKKEEKKKEKEAKKPKKEEKPKEKEKKKKPKAEPKEKASKKEEMKEKPEEKSEPKESK